MFLLWRLWRQLYIPVVTSLSMVDVIGIANYARLPNLKREKRVSQNSNRPTSAEHAVREPNIRAEAEHADEAKNRRGAPRLASNLGLEHEPSLRLRLCARENPPNALPMLSDSHRSTVQVSLARAQPTQRKACPPQVAHR